MFADTLIPLLSYVLISTFTPGPNNISSASLGVLYGYKGTLRYQAGMGGGVFAIMIVCGWVSGSLLAHFPAIETPLRLIGAAYILYLASSMLKASYQFKAQDEKPLGFNQGFLLQLLNPKLFVYALTLFTGFLAPITTSLPLLILAACLLAVVAFCATSGWALFGTVVKAYLRHPRVKLIVNIVLSLALVYTALELAGLV
jgi:cysteine/O-acetylserine efflux protein